MADGKVTKKVEQINDINVGDLVCGHPVERIRHDEMVIRGARVWAIPMNILQALCDSGHVTRDVDAAEAVEWFDHNDTHWSARFSGDVIGVVAKDGRFYFKVYDPSFTTIIEAKFLELTGGKNS